MAAVMSQAADARCKNGCGSSAFCNSQGCGIKPMKRKQKKSRLLMRGTGGYSQKRCMPDEAEEDEDLRTRKCDVRDYGRLIVRAQHQDREGSSKGRTVSGIRRNMKERKKNFESGQMRTRFFVRKQKVNRSNREAEAERR